MLGIGVFLELSCSWHRSGGRVGDAHWAYFGPLLKEWRWSLWFTKWGLCFSCDGRVIVSLLGPHLGVLGHSVFESSPFQLEPGWFWLAICSSCWGFQSVDILNVGIFFAHLYVCLYTHICTCKFVFSLPICRNYTCAGLYRSWLHVLLCVFWDIWGCRCPRQWKQKYSPSVNTCSWHG